MDLVLRWLAFAVALGVVPSAAAFQTEATSLPPGTVGDDIGQTRPAVTLKPYHGPTTHDGSPTLEGTVMSGYQGWFTCPGDGSGRGWRHWSKGRRFAPGACSIDLWPDVSELTPGERFETEFRLSDGSPASVFSSLHPETIDRHFRWMREHDLDGVFVQRFAVEVRGDLGRRQSNAVIRNCQASANRHGRAWAMMYDLSGLPAGGTQTVIDDWKMLVDQMQIGRDSSDKAYLRHRQMPLVAVWGVGFNDGRKYTIEECQRLVRFFKDDPEYGGNSVMLGVPSYWRTLQRDALDDPAWHEIVRQVDVVSPWSVGRFADDRGVERYAREVWRPDLAWCVANEVDYLPVVFPGFSWHNMRPDAPLGQIPRRGGAFLWKQFVELRRAGVAMAYQAMFDEVDEATAIFKCTNQPPVGASPFLDYEGLPTDHYLWLVGQGRRLLGGEIPLTEELPSRE